MSRLDGLVDEGSYAAPPSRWTRLHDGPLVHWVDYGGPAGAPLLVGVHGLGGSTLNWAAVAPLLTHDVRVVALDLPGFGLSQAGATSTSVTANQEVLHRFLTDVAGGPAVLMGNSMGGVITVLQAARQPETSAGVVLLDPALPTDLRTPPHPLVTLGFALYSVPRVGDAVLLRRRRGKSTEQVAMDVLRMVCANPFRIPADVLDQLLALAASRSAFEGIDAQFLVAARSLVRLIAPGRRYAQAIDQLGMPVLLLHGELDRLVPVAAARAVAAAHPAWRFRVAEGVGHVPQLEAPGWTAAQILGWVHDVLENSVEKGSSPARVDETRVENVCGRDVEKRRGIRDTEAVRAEHDCPPR